MRAGRRLLAVSAVVAVLGLTACSSAASDSGSAPSSSAAAAPSGASARVGDLDISGAYLPQPASPDVASVYFTVTNKGNSADTLVSASTPMAASVTLHETTTTASGAETMVPLTEMDVPAGGTAALQVGGKHLMVEQPTAKLVQGDEVPVTLVFTKAGSVTVDVPVTAIGAQDGMGDMSGMDMGS